MSNVPPLARPENVGAQSYASWRERFLLRVLQGTSVLGLLGIILYFFTPSSAGLKLLALFMYGLLLLVTWSPRFPYTLRAGIFLLLLFFAGFSSLLDYGTGESSVLFLGFIVMTGLLLSTRSAVYYALGLSVLSLILFGRQGSSILEWVRDIGIFLIIGSSITIGLRTALQDFIKTQEAAQQILNTLRQERAQLEERVEERTAVLRQRTEQLRATSYIARKTAELQELEPLLTTVAKLVSDQFGFYHAGIFLLNSAGNQAILQAASSEGGQRMLEQGHALPVGTQNLVGYVVTQKKPRIAMDVGEDAVFFNNPDLPMTRSQVALPLLVRDKVLGVLDIQSDKPQAFSSDDIDTLQTLADQIAIAIENARLMDETQSAMTQLEALTSLRTREAWSQKLQDGNRVFTFTPLGLRAEKVVQPAQRTVSVPIILRGQKIGTISIARKGEATWSQADRAMIEEVAAQVGLAVDNIRLLEEATQRARQEQTIGKLAARFSQSLDLDTLLQTAARELGQLPDVSEISVFVGQDSEAAPQPRQSTKRRPG
ncbi:MAG TPA: GAF domain-containing protein [Anaerolineales bacterium]|nr:GAF domain-containing protein [Anaerolineales bacterium]